MVRLLATRGDTEMWGEPGAEEVTVRLPDGREHTEKAIVLMKAGYWDFTDPEVKHPGPKGAPVHSTGTPQDAHGGSLIEDPTDRARQAIFEGVAQTINIPDVARYVTDTLQDALDSGQLGDEPNARLGGRSAQELFTAAIDAVPLYVSAASLEAGKDPDGPIHKGLHLDALMNLREIAQSIEDKQFTKPLLLNVLTSEERLGRVSSAVDRMSQFEGVEPQDVARIVKPDRSKYDAEFKREVQAQVVADWTEDQIDYEEPQQMWRAMAPGHPGNASEPENIARDLIQSWASTSNDGNPASLVVQEAAEREFEIEGASGWDREGPGLSDFDKGTLDGTLRSMYDRTQAWFEERGIEEVTVWRGQKGYEVVGLPREVHGRVIVDQEEFDDGSGRVRASLDDGSEIVLSPSDPALTREPTLTADQVPGSGFDTVRQRPLSSWSLSPEVASGFTTPSGSVMRATVPVSRILSTPRTGFGCTNEEECVLLGGEMNIEWEYVSYL